MYNLIHILKLFQVNCVNSCHTSPFHKEIVKLSARKLGKIHCLNARLQIECINKYLKCTLLIVQHS